MREDKKPAVTRNFMKNLSRGAVKSIPIGGALLEQVIYGTLDGEAAKKEAEKLHAALSGIAQKLEGQDVSFGDVLNSLEKEAAFREEIISQMGEIRALLKDPEKAAISNRVQNAVASDKVKKAEEGAPHAFISHSSQDKSFVRKLARDLERERICVWLDEWQLRVGDSIVEGISKVLKDTDYFIIVLSKASVRSNWVKAELNAALMEELSNKGTVVLPVLIEDCEIPTLLKDRRYADFRSDYESGLKSIIDVLVQESKDVSSAIPPEKIRRGDKGYGPLGCVTTLSELSMAELRRRISKRMGRDEVSTIWFDTFEKKMEDDMANRTKNECVVSLIVYAQNRGRMLELLKNLCEERPDLVNP